MSDRDDQKTSSEESKSGEEVDARQKALLEEEIKKIISDLDVKFDEGSHDDGGSVEGKANSTSTKMQPLPDGGERETASTVSGATVVHHRVLPKVTSVHVKSERRDWQQRSEMPIFSYEYGDRTDLSAQHYPEFYQPERDEITEQTTTSETLISTLDSTTYGLSTPSIQMPSYRNTLPHLPALAEESTLRPQTVETNVFQMQGCVAQDQNPPCMARLSMERENLPGVGHTDLRATYQPCQDYQPRPPEYQPCLNEYPSQYQPEYSPQPRYSNQSQEGYPQHNQNIDRYNSTHMTFSTAKPPGKKRSFTDNLLAKSRNMFRKTNDSDSGEVIPQLYKATIKNGTSPPRFTFKAVTGIQPPLTQCCCAMRAPYAGGYAPSKGFCGAPRVPSNTQQCCPPAFQESQCPTFEPQCDFSPCSCKVPEKNTSAVRLKRGGCDNCEVTQLPSNDNIKTRAYYTDLGCGYISQSSVPEKVDIYCFDQLNTGFFRTSDHPPPLFADIAVQRTEKYSTVFWAEIFGVLNVVTAFIIAMFLQTFKFLLQGILRPVMIGFVQLLSDYLIKPFLTLLYNGFTQPISIFLYNVTASIRDVLQPMAKGIGFFVELIAVVLRAVRLVEVKNVTNITPYGAQPARC